MQNYRPELPQAEHSKFKIFIIFSAILLFGYFLSLYLIPAFRGEIEIAADFHVGPFAIRWYGLLLAAAVLISFLLARSLAFRERIDPVHFEKALFPLLVGGLLGARAYFVIFTWPEFEDDFLEIFKIWQGGLSIYGAILGGLGGAFWYARRAKLSVWNFFDVLFTVLPLGQSLGRLGNFFNQEAFGSPTQLPWKLFVPPELRPKAYLEHSYFHPTFLYEAVWNLLVFAVLLYLFRRKRKSGLITASYFLLYPLGRFFIEGLRVDSFFVGEARVDQITSLFLIFIGGWLLAKIYAKGPGLENH